MSRREVAELACRVLALYLSVKVLDALWQFSANLFAIRQGYDPNALWTVFLMAGYLVAVFGVAALLWSKTDYFARRMAADDPAPVTRNDWDPETVLSVACAIIGVYALIRLDTCCRLLPTQSLSLPVG